MKATKKTMKPKMAKGGKMIQTAGNALTKALLGQGYNERPAKMQKGGEMGEKMNKYMNLSVNLTVTKDKTEPKETESESKMKKGGKMVKKAALGAMMGPPRYKNRKKVKVDKSSSKGEDNTDYRSKVDKAISILKDESIQPTKSVSNLSKRQIRQLGIKTKTGRSPKANPKFIKKKPVDLSKYATVVEKKMAKGGKMSKFDKLASSVAKSYMKKGKSATAAKKIGAAVAAKVGMAKFGKKKMTAMAVKGKKKK